MTKQNETLTQEEQVWLLWDKEEIKDTMARNAYYTANDERRRAITELWVSDEDHRNTASMGYNNGYYVGLDNIIKHFVVDAYDLRMENLKAYQAAGNTADIQRHEKRKRAVLRQAEGNGQKQGNGHGSGKTGDAAKNNTNHNAYYHQKAVGGGKQVHERICKHRRHNQNTPFKMPLGR